MRTGLQGDRHPAVRQQFFDPFDGMFRNAPEHIAEPGKRIDSCQFTGGNETAQRRRCSATIPKARTAPASWEQLRREYAETDRGAADGGQQASIAWDAADHSPQG